MQVAVGQDDEPDILGLGVAAGLLLADKRVELLGLRFQNGKWEAPFIEQQVVRVPIGRLLEVVAQSVEGLLLEFDVRFQCDVGGACVVIKEPPTRPSEQIVDENPAFASLAMSPRPSCMRVAQMGR